MKKKIIISISVIVLVVAAILVKNIITNRNINDKEKMAQIIQKEQSVDSVKVRKTVKSKDTIYVLYEDSKKQIGLAEFENSGKIIKKYQYCCLTEPLPFSYYTIDISGEKDNVLIVFGNNKGDGDRYEFKAYGKTYTENISNQKDVLKVYRISNNDTQGKNTTNELAVYDKNNKVIDKEK